MLIVQIQKIGVCFMLFMARQPAAFCIRSSHFQPQLQEGTEDSAPPEWACKSWSQNNNNKCFQWEN